MSTVILSSLEPGIAHLQLSRPERRNALAPELVSDLHDALTEIARDRSVRVVILSDVGKGFCAGAAEGAHIEAALETPRLIRENNGYGVWMTKNGLAANLDAPSLRHAIELEDRTQVLGTFTGNMEEAMKAFQAGRSPVWKPL